MSRATAPRHGPRAQWRAIDGVLLLDKPQGITSSAAVQRVRRVLLAAKAGHTGTLDPMATGLLPVCLGEATKFSHLLLDADKGYLATVRLGMTTSTGDLEGTILTRAPVTVGRGEVETVLARFRGPLQQTPPMYSALKHGGQPLYKLARSGREIPRTARSIVIHSLTLSAFENGELTLRVTCSKGTYVRVLAEDIGRELGCGACLSGLRREGVGAFSLASGAVTLTQLEQLAPPERDALLLPADALVASLPRLELDAAKALRVGRGQSVDCSEAPSAGLACIYGPGQVFLGVVEVTTPGRITPKRLRSQAPAATRNDTSIA